MLNQLKIALSQHLDEQGEKWLEQGNKKALDEAFTAFDAEAQETLSALQGFANLLFWHGINEDDTDTNQETSITAHFLISTATLLKNNLELLELSLYAKDRTGDFLYKLAKGGSNEY